MKYAWVAGGLLVVIGIASLVFLFITKGAVPPVAGKASPAPDQPSARTAATSPPSTAPPGETMRWLAERSPGFTIQQARDERTKEPVGTISSGPAVGDLGETPPVYRYQLDTAAGPILMGDAHNRHQFRYSLSGVSQSGDRLTIHPLLSVSVPRSVYFAGLAFRKEQDPVREVGILLPPLKVPAGLDPDSDPFAIIVRLEARGETIAREELENAPYEDIEHSCVVLGNPVNTRPVHVQVLWLSLEGLRRGE